MKKPNKLYRKLGGHKTALGHGFAIARHPVRELRKTLRNSFGKDTDARRVAEGMAENEFSRVSYFKVMQVLNKWCKSYRGPSLSRIFFMNGARQQKMNLPKPGLDLK